MSEIRPEKYGRHDLLARLTETALQQTAFPIDFEMKLSK